MTEISVIIPAYNQAVYVAQAVQSVCDQTFTDWELIVVDDGSTDDTLQVLAGFHDSRIHVIRQANQGVSAARNTGIRNSLAPLITFLDADDLFTPEKLTVLYEYLKDHPEVGLVVGGMRSIDASGQMQHEIVIESAALTFPSLLFENNVPLGGVMVRREWLERAGGFDESMHTCEDWDLWLRMVVAGCKLSRVDKVVVAYRIHSEQVTRNAGKMRIDSLRMWEKFFQLQNLPADLLAYRPYTVASALVRTAARAFRSNEFVIGNNDLITAIQLEPRLKREGYKQIVVLFRGWANDPQIEDSETYLLKVSSHLSPKLFGLRRQLRKAVADMILGSLFSTPQELWRTRRNALIKAIAYDPACLTNRGVLRMIVVAWFPLPTKGAV